MKFLLTFSYLLLLTNLNAQSQLISGLWDGHLVLNQQKYTIEMNINVKNNGKLNGFTSVSLPDGRVVEMKIRGQLHMDRSVTVREFRIVNKDELEDVDWYKRNFQLMFKRDLWQMTLEGYWQEQIPQMVDEKTRIGRVFLKKREVKA
ncbi:MAG: hypothetical protein ACI9XO_000450 [Paraglaciecola sp.]|jgi:hypothetical protein